MSENKIIFDKEGIPRIIINEDKWLKQKYISSLLDDYYKGMKTIDKIVYSLIGLIIGVNIMYISTIITILVFS